MEIDYKYKYEKNDEIVNVHVKEEGQESHPFKETWFS